MFNINKKTGDYDEQLVEIAKKTKKLWKRVRPYMAESFCDAEYTEDIDIGKATLEITDDLVDLMDLAIADRKRQNRQMKNMDEKLDKLIKLMEEK